ncbi:Uncharacterised protein [Clostridium perfringens]|nr:Uncharacterised protein [Clostridium perfringens]
MSNGSQIANDFYANIEIQSLTLNFIFSKKGELHMNNLVDSINKKLEILNINPYRNSKDNIKIKDNDIEILIEKIRIKK